MTDLATKPGASDEESPDDAVDGGDAELDHSSGAASEDGGPEDDTAHTADDPAADGASATTEVIEPDATIPHEDARAVAAADASTESAAGPPADAALYAWAPTEPARRRRRTPLWIGLAAGVALVGLVASSLVLIAPGTSVAGVGVGGLTQGGAAGALQQRLDDTTIVLAGDGGDAVVTGADLGASVDARALAEDAFAEHPMWNPTQWFPASIDAPVHIDPATADAALRKAAPGLYADPVDASLAYDAATAKYVTTAAKPGQGIDVDAVRAALQNAYDSGKTRVTFTPAVSPIAPTTTTETAAATAKSLNNILGTAGFYVGEERTVPVDRATVASWLTVTHQPDGTFTTTADKAAIQKLVETLPKAINRDVVNATVITNSAGRVLRQVTAGVAGRTLGDTRSIAADYAAQLARGKGVYVLPVTVNAFTTTSLARRIEVNISQQHAYLFENGRVVYSYPISSGLPGHDTNLGHFHIYSKVKSQNMGNPDLTKAPNYYTKNVPNISYFDGDEALHGAWWHHNFGHRMSHGCVNMPLDAAALVYTWAPIGTEVWVHL
ncbi:L,D-transpeptidase family protein [Microbacterium deminutum]|uniref:L,D-transpeptidase family protein n=1 Tax=Microbacterium deminutum TaxID=344164 RepID=UPI0031D7E79E